MSSTFEWNDIAGALPWGTDWIAGPSGQTSRAFLALSETHAGPEEDDDEEEDGVEGPPKPSSVAARATPPPRTRATRTAGTPTHNVRTRFIAYLPHFDVIVWR
jgi:hypothetical protein